nr:glycosyltransferase family 2 protein [Halarchaeum sp. CBA1220]
MPALSSAVLTGLVVLLWAALLLYGASALWWLVEVLALRSKSYHPESSFAHGLEEVQVRVLTIGAEDVVQATVNSVPDGVADVRVIAEKPIDVEGARVHVVPEGFECAATNKGRAIEWARREVPCEREYVLYLDEDTLVTSLTGLPDADVVQFTEKPIYTGSALAYICEVFRVGYQIEQTAFDSLRYPLYAWGGGIAFRREIEDAVTWDVPTVTEDTNFVWRAADHVDLDFAVVNARFRNQAPPSVTALVKQRRRWLSGTMQDDTLPTWYTPLAYTRVVAWAFSPLVPVLVVAAYLIPGSAPGLELYGLVSTCLLAVLVVYMLGGCLAYRKHPLLWPLFVLATPLAVVTHAIGALWGVIAPVETFEVTEKVTPETIEDVHESTMERGDIAAHDGTERLVADSADEYRWQVFDD